MDIDFIFPTSWLNKATDWDIDKVYRIPSQSIIDREKLCYNRAKAISKSLREGHKVNWFMIIENLNEDINFIQTLIKENLISYKQLLSETIKIWKCLYADFNHYIDVNILEISAFVNDKEKSIDEMNADELREYIKKHNIK